MNRRIANSDWRMAGLGAGMRWVACGLLGVAILRAACLQGDAQTAVIAEGPRSVRGFSYVHDEDLDVPWSIHVLKVRLGHPDLALHTTLGNAGRFGMATVPDQVRGFPRALGGPVGAINGDFYETDEHCEGRPRDLQVLRGELVSGPNGHVCFWLDAEGRPQLGTVESRFRVVWQDGTSTPVRLNEPRAADRAMLYTSAVGLSTHTRGGRDVVLERDPTAAPDTLWLPLAPCRTYLARVREVILNGDAPLTPDVLVVSVGETLAPKLPAPAPGQSVRLILETTPDLTGVETAIGGGPTLVRDGKARQWSGIQFRHPRSAIGWNDETLFLVQVDGRQAGLSVGMSFPELARYMVKLGCHTAMNLDGGGSATMWVMGNVMNSPSEGQVRPAANALVVVEKPKRPSHE